MANNEIIALRDVLSTVASEADSAWIYLRPNEKWNLDSDCAILESEEVPPALEDDPDAGVPEFAKHHGLIRVLPVTVVQDIVINALGQKPDATLEELFECFIFYFKRDAFIDLRM